MTAKELFENLDWECEEDQGEDFHDIKYIKDEGSGNLTEITFDLIDKNIRFFSYDSIVNIEVYATYITPQLLKTINKQAEELGWLNN